jgi:hypothetical protein
MSEPYVYKAQSERGKGPIILLPYDTTTPPTITLSDGRVLTAVRGDQKGASYKGHNGYQWIFPNDVLGQTDATLTVDGKTQELPTTNSSWRGGSIGSLTESSKGAIGDFTGGEVGGSGTVGLYGAVPDYVGDLFPKVATTKYKNIQNAGDKFKFTDPIEFGKQFGEANRAAMEKNQGQAKSFAFDALDTELQGLLNYVPKSAALKREQVGLDNTFNQAERTRQVNTAIPDVVSDVNRIASDARQYAGGEIPNSVVDKAMALGTRSAAADIAASSGFGVGSSAARKLSDLMSAKDRIGLSQYGESLLSQNAAQRADLFLAPTQYSDAGAQVNVSPSISGSQLQTSAYNEINNKSLVDANTGLTSVINQNQFLTNTLQQTNQFNAQNRLQNKQFNASNANNFALSKFNYEVEYANSVAGATQTSINTGISLDQQDAARDEANKQKDKTQKGNTIGSVVGAITSVGAAIFSDVRLKDNFCVFEDALNHLNALQIFEYNYKEDATFRKRVGVKAQELQTVFPNMVYETETEEKYLVIDPTDLIFVLIKAVKELAGKVEALEKK